MKRKLRIDDAIAAILHRRRRPPPYRGLCVTLPAMRHLEAMRAEWIIPVIDMAQRRDRALDRTSAQRWTLRHFVEGPALICLARNRTLIVGMDIGNTTIPPEGINLQFSNGVIFLIAEQE